MNDAGGSAWRRNRKRGSKSGSEASDRKPEPEDVIKETPGGTPTAKLETETIHPIHVEKYRQFSTDGATVDQ